jgi:hypothetical protein
LELCATWASCLRLLLLLLLVFLLLLLLVMVVVVLLLLLLVLLLLLLLLLHPQVMRHLRISNRPVAGLHCVGATSAGLAAASLLPPHLQRQVLQRQRHWQREAAV